MVTVTTNSGSDIWDLRGLSDDVKPTNVPNGSTFYVMDAKKKNLDTTLYMFDKDNEEWLPQ